MSRCFPFPPPGYDKKITETDPLLKEKYKEKNHKKDKDKEKREVKDRSKDKDKERKKKREKHKDRKDKEKDKEKCKPSEEKKTEVLPNTGNREKLVTNTVQNNSNGESKYVQELGRRIRYDEEATGSQNAQRITNQKGTPGKAFLSSSFCPVQETNYGENDDQSISTQKNFAVGKPMENRDKARHTKSPETSHLKESAAMSDKPRDEAGLKKKTESINKSHQDKSKLIEGPKLKERGKDSLDIRNGRPPDLSQASVKNLIAEGSLGKRMDLDTNGLLYENGTKPNKLQRHSASVSSVENGRTLGSHRSPASEVQGTACKPEVKEAKVNGFVVSGEKEKVCSQSHVAAAMKAKVKENGEASAKPPHPDLKLLDQILSVPKRELFLEVDNDEEWLYGQLGVKLKKARKYSPDSGESLQVWNQAFRIESADILALPYVVPF
ncbi:hypothetical protein HID58_077030 [Brassica napus]|uniref:Uncharacterized protein n=2 Tax=Brassica TaxID=3705 RepID=A0ABQ7YPH1_BRANA|nr:PREDICTED: TRAF3-interacting protein 1 [Brassica oleracea var. oleracea]XP_013598427.1 PREDICTED: TRAF3-interacting protein 1 [Brassica oleracea var. oleracea]XP_013598428.1 PREDICTED: TRAF3-interacting protein 1 [Brassica oleracea var. oleracea]XP_013598429.1 PREDICTED: TRAF3-interacting protein 1 [Brassica oleracea var. oleracea]XP_013598430.1 PREDICTED: TRAF3-interacting protein 1 [Brassica oleracea var. oleracea]XP_013644320.2 TRAF3-interacting protein 1 [Brassica napus]XP_013644321.2 